VYDRTSSARKRASMRIIGTNGSSNLAHFQRCVTFGGTLPRPRKLSLVSNCVSKSNIFSFAAGELLPWSIRRVPLSDSNW